MQMLRHKLSVFLAGSMLGIILCAPVVIYSQDSGINARIPEGVYIKLTKDFYEALKNEGSVGTKVYTNNPSNEHLKQIAIATKFMVETNLEILKQQEIMNQLLQSLLQDRKK
ncbi:MAG: hypothetical protein ABIK98_13765 [Pseudomonadota bacterium]